MKKGVSLCGRICSGKTTIAKELCKKHKFSRISFGDYLRGILNKQKKSDTRENLQKIGLEIIKKGDYKNFLIRTINCNKPIYGTHVYDSIRHIEMIKEANKIYDDFIIIFLESDLKTRYKRYLLKNDKISYNDNLN